MDRVLRSTAVACACAVAAGALGTGCSARAARPGTGPADGGGEDGGGPAYDAANDAPWNDSSSGSGCESGAEWIYLVDADRTLIRFQPDALTLTPIGTLSCPASGGATPFSMSVDRDATAWVLYSSGELFRVSTADASCASTGFAPNQHGLEIFGMGFASDVAGGETETLYVAGGSLDDVGFRESTFGVLRLDSLTIEVRGSVPGSPELTGTGEGELWGFFPSNFDVAALRQLDKSTGATLLTETLPDVSTFGTEAWAFAFWGARFYVFIKTALAPSTEIWRVDPDTHEATRVVGNTGYRVVGAGVSTCAPVILI